MAETFYQLPVDTSNAGEKVRYNSLVVGADTVHALGTYLTDPNTAANVQAVTPKGTQGSYAAAVQDLKDAGRNATNYFMALPIVTTAAEVMMSLTGYKGGVAVAATATPAVVTTGKIYRVESIAVTYVAIATGGTVRVTLRANLSGVGVIGSPLVWQKNVGAAIGAGAAATTTFEFGDGFEFAAGTGLAVGIQGYGPTQTAAAVGYAQVSILGYEY